MKGQTRAVLLGLGAAVLTYAWLAGAAQDNLIGATVVPAATLAQSGPTGSGESGSVPPPPTNSLHLTQAAQALSPGIREILRLADAGVSPDVLKAYAEAMQFVAPLTAADVLALKQHSVPDEVTTVLLKRSAPRQVQYQNPPTQASAPSMAPPQNAPAAAGYLDPESYDYFQYYYLRPRTLASVQETLGYYPYPYSFGYYSPFAFGFYPYGGSFGHGPYVHHGFGPGGGFSRGAYAGAHMFSR